MWGQVGENLCCLVWFPLSGLCSCGSSGLCVAAQLQYPEEILQFKYDPDFAIRGLHFDYQKVSLLLMYGSACILVFSVCDAWCDVVHGVLVYVGAACAAFLHCRDC